MARTLAGINTTARSRTPIAIPKADSVEELRKATEKTLNQHADQANRVANILQNDLDAGGFKIQNLGNPTANKDAVPLDFLKKSLQNITIKGARGTGGGADQGLAHFGIAIGFPVAVGTDLTAHHIVSMPGTFQAAYVNSKLGPTGADLIIDIQLWNGSSWGSIFGATKLVLPDGSADTDLGTQTTFVTAPALGNLLRADVVQSGSTFPGQDISVMIRWA